MSQAKDLTCSVFVNIPGMSSSMKPKDMDLFLKTWPQRSRQKGSTFCFKMLGTTFSGHPTKTTLGNTLRSMCYQHYLIVKSGIETSKFMCAGDDVVCWVKRDEKDALLASIALHTSDTKDAQIKGLGQVIKMVDV